MLGIGFEFGKTIIDRVDFAGGNIGPVLGSVCGGISVDSVTAVFFKHTHGCQQSHAKHGTPFAGCSFPIQMPLAIIIRVTNLEKLAGGCLGGILKVRPSFRSRYPVILGDHLEPKLSRVFILGEPRRNGRRIRYPGAEGSERYFRMFSRKARQYSFFFIPAKALTSDFLSGWNLRMK